jgi:flavin-binding protein dodecin
MTVARITELTSSSTKSFEDALNQGIARATKTLRNVTGAWVMDQQVVVSGDDISEYRLRLKVTFVLSD